MTYKDLVRKYIPDASDEEIGFILWEHTCFPMGSSEMVEKLVRDYAVNRIVKNPELLEDNK